MSDIYVAAIDLGSYQVIGAVAKKSENGLEIIDIEREKSEKGCIDKGGLVSIDKAAMHISRMIQMLKNGSLLKEINYVYVSWHGMDHTDEKCAKLTRKLVKNVIVLYPKTNTNTLITSLFTTEEERRNGVLTIDFGDTCTSYTYYNDSDVSYYGSLPGGSHTITTDLMSLFDFEEEIAEKLKLMFGKALPTEGVDQLISLNKENTKNVRVSELSKNILLRIEDIFKRVLNNMVKTQWNSNKKRVILLAGGGSKLPYLDKLLHRQTGLEIRIAKCGDGLITGDKALKIESPEYAMLLSLLNYADKACDEKRPKKSTIGHFLGMVFPTGNETATQTTMTLFNPSEENEKM